MNKEVLVDILNVAYVVWALLSIALAIVTDNITVLIALLCSIPIATVIIYKHWKQRPKKKTHTSSD